jgi:CubicO group peptidase (beta-lactamase class C family)
MIQPIARLRAASFVVTLLFTALAQAAGSDPLPRAAPEEVGISTERLQRLDGLLQSYVDEGKLAGGVLLVARRGKLVYLQPFGQRDREARAPMQADSIFRIASQTKALVSVGIMMLTEQGKLLLSDPLSKFVPEFKETTVAVPKEGGGYDVVKAKRPITIRDLLTHTAGIGYGTGVAEDKWKAAGIGGWYFADRKEPVAATVARMAALPNDAQPGEKWVYGYSIDILGVVIEKVSGKPLDEFLRANVIDPLGMKDTAFYLPAAKRDRLTVVYSGSESGKLERAPNPGAMVGQGAYLEGPRTSFSGGAGLLSTAGDYGRFLQMMLNGGELDGKRLLSRKTVELMLSDHLRGLAFQEGAGMGLGFSVLKDLGARGTPGSLGEFGWGGAYHSTYWADPREQLIVVYLTQLIPAPGIDDFGKVRSLVYQSLVD